ncbi:hypothetical protein FHR92_002094 [Fontibacillus solani]|uniref:Lipoprotein n=1 Tax=Fontibacillus solani TaxID=1572857 RepID=A0A7W3ST15_9BACL|nr:hypothetical protein [Fontibacillus solani]MBA9085627.1 hypothetical protein [Fontibacillus solani]
MSNKIKFLVVASLILTIITSCSEKPKIKNHSEFFAWMDAYIAVEENVTNSIAVTMFFDKVPYAPDEITNISFIGLQDKIIIDEFQVTQNQQATSNYSSYVLTLNYKALDRGIFQTSGITINMKSKEKIQYPIGNWTFDVDAPDAGNVDTWSSPAASSNGSEFAYQYSANNSSGNIKKIYYGNGLYIGTEKGIELSGIINLKDHYSSPVVYIKTKIIYFDTENDYVNYGKGTYCGALNEAEEIILKSRDHNKVVN